MNPHSYSSPHAMVSLCPSSERMNVHLTMLRLPSVNFLVRDSFRRKGGEVAMEQLGDKGILVKYSRSGPTGHHTFPCEEYTTYVSIA